jgi:hypothetical protein
MRIVEVKYPLPNQKPSYATLYVNGVELGQWIHGKEKKYENPEKWADQQIRKRNIVICANILRLEEEIAQLKEEEILINRK